MSSINRKNPSKRNFFGQFFGSFRRDKTPKQMNLRKMSSVQSSPFLSDFEADVPASGLVTVASTETSKNSHCNKVKRNTFTTTATIEDRHSYYQNSTFLQVNPVSTFKPDNTVNAASGFNFIFVLINFLFSNFFPFFS